MTVLCVCVNMLSGDTRSVRYVCDRGRDRWPLDFSCKTLHLSTQETQAFLARRFADYIALLMYTVFRKKWYILFSNITSQLQARFSYNFQ